MKAKLLLTLGGVPCDEFPDGTRPAGTVIDHPDAYKLVRRGCAVPADQECTDKASMTPEMAQRARDAYAKADAGLLPEDYPAWDAGWMRGYNPDGSWIPGPNAADLDELEWEERKRNSPLELS